MFRYFLVLSLLIWPLASEAAKKKSPRAKPAAKTAKSPNGSKEISDICAMQVLGPEWFATRPLPAATKLKASDPLRGKQLILIPAAKDLGWAYGMRLGKLTAANRAYLGQQIENFRTLNSILTANLQGFDYVSRALQHALMLQTHALLFGEPGAGKTDIANMLAAAPVRLSNGKVSNASFRLMLHQMSTDIEIRGLVDYMSMMDWAGNPSDTDPSRFIRNRFTLLNAPRVLLDEIEKSTGKSLQALNDILANRQMLMGPFSLASKVETVFATTNLAPAPFVHLYQMLGLRSTAEPLLDRFPIKVWTTNFLAESADRRDLLLAGWANTVFKSMSRGQVPGYFDPPDRPLIIQEPSPLPEVDFRFFGEIAATATYLRPDFTANLDCLIKDLRTYYNKAALNDEIAAQSEDRAASKYPANLISNRTLYNFATQIIAISTFFDLLRLVSRGVDTEDIFNILERGIPLDRFSIWRVAHLLLYSLPGRFQPEVSANENKVELIADNQVKLLKEQARTIQEANFLEAAMDARTHFGELYQKMMKDSTAHSMKLADHLRMIEGLNVDTFDSQKQSLELFLMKMSQLHGIR